ncbi:hypothetical protein PHYBLDRAFT_63946 [Phycomyces blakesleeanus NRRL 1555(-)]|uniref:Uncharacterized protein n=1 Tax=Phycomyces blakesleeanus (strain ATCC 8743b / DSM 1359 / FGSC 10004 / NBRC 33097 / NRRL 1555) TaxID=763407 RepID=A0A162UCJ5_PHYB8|nr:hypothetical protein PHYBLDRAFT_63946 [Phycomyces blakesleeanus NRRL 1555(-)]OAD74103.1 hypothetical protein PHYBLDRAFT_63946 [Phycomyces blakesleeanus NRRL 1555(-)]|eukprot:XP_018292143.1 hypothetical protein PHYBLDRAFT_63946 [Phycomyces blakesleeanus NRRL 1555(-)]
MLVENSKAESSRPTNLSTSVGSNAIVASQSTSSSNVSEFGLALKALPKKVHAGTTAIYRMPFEHWKDFCEEKKRHRYPVHSQYPYTVEPTNFVIAFFKEFALKQAYTKSVSVDRFAENAASNKNGSKKVIEVPLGIEAVSQYKKFLMFLHEFRSERREGGWPSPKKTKEVIELIKKYEHNLVYDQVQTNVDRAAHCVIQDSYKSGELIRVLKSLWTPES